MLHRLPPRQLPLTYTTGDVWHDVISHRHGFWQRCRPGERLLGFFWVSTPDCDMVLVTGAGLELFKLAKDGNGLTAVEVKKHEVAWCALHSRDPHNPKPDETAHANRPTHTGLTDPRAGKFAYACVQAHSLEYMPTGLVVLHCLPRSFYQPQPYHNHLKGCVDAKNTADLELFVTLAGDWTAVYSQWRSADFMNTQHLSSFSRFSSHPFCEDNDSSRRRAGAGRCDNAPDPSPNLSPNPITQVRVHARDAAGATGE